MLHTKIDLDSSSSRLHSGIPFTAYPLALILVVGLTLHLRPRRIPTPLLRLSWELIATMASNKASGHADMHCPDPSMHDKQNQLSAAASTAALYVTNPQTKSERVANPREDVLDSDGKLSSKSKP